MLRRTLFPTAVACGLLVAGATGCFASAAQPGPPGRSAVGVAKRSDGAVAVVTAWCMGERRETLRIAGFDGEIQDAMYAATGESSSPVTVHTIGREEDNLVPSRSHAIPSGEQLIAYNSGERGDLLLAHAYPSSVALFTVDRLPVSDEPLPTQLVAGNQQRITLRELITRKCLDPTAPISGG